MAESAKEKTQQKKIKQLLAQLQGGDLKKVKAALEGLQVHGDSGIIAPLFQFLMNSEEGPAYSEVLEFLSSLKNSDSKKVVIACLRDRKYEDCRQQILSSIWNSPLDYSEYLSDFVRAAVSYDYMDSLESLTIIENLDGPFEEKEVLESQLLLRDYHEGKFSKSREKDQLVSEVALFIKSFNEHLDDFDDFELLEEED